VEVLVAAVVFSLGLGGLSLMLLNSVQGSVSAANRTTAAMHAASMAGLIQLNPSSQAYLVDTLAYAGGNCFAPESCSESAWAAGNLARWRNVLEQSLPGGSGLVCLDLTPDDGSAAEPACDGQGGAVVKVFWTEPRPVAGGDTTRNRFVLPLAL